MEDVFWTALLTVLLVGLVIFLFAGQENLMLYGWPEKDINEWGQYLNHIVYPRNDLYPNQDTLDGMLQNKAPYAVDTDDSANVAKNLLEEVYDRDESNIDDMCTWRKSFGDYQTKMAKTYRSTFGKRNMAPWFQRELYENEQRRWWDNDKLDYKFIDPESGWAQKSWPGGIDEQALYMP